MGNRVVIKRLEKRSTASKRSHLMQKFSEKELQKLIKKCLQNDRQSQNQLFNAHAPYLMAVVKRYVRYDFASKSVLLSSFEKIFDKLNSYDPQKGRFQSWIKRIAINESLTHISKSKNFEPIDSHSQLYYETEIDLNREMDMRQVYEIIENLKHPYSVIFNLVMEGYKHKEIAELLNITEGTSRSYYKRSRTMLMSQLSKFNFESNEQKV